MIVWGAVVLFLAAAIISRRIKHHGRSEEPLKPANELWAGEACSASVSSVLRASGLHLHLLSRRSCS
jgi:hypothetical protein